MDDGPVYIGNGIPKLAGNGDDQTDNDIIQIRLPEGYALEQNYPNPFNPQTEIRFNLPEDGIVSLKVYDLLGRKITSLLEGALPAGAHRVIFDGQDLSSGIYLCALKVNCRDGNAFMQMKRMILMK